MQHTIETISTLERRMNVSVVKADIDAEVAKRLARLAKQTSMPGFRRGKVPVRLIERSHGAQVQAEVLSEKVGGELSSALAQNQLRMAGAPRVQARPDGDAASANFVATFEIYPEIPAIDPAALRIERVVCPVGDAEVSKTIDVMRRQRGVFKAAARAARDGDRVRIDFRGTIDGVAFAGGTAQGYTFDLGQGRMLAEFENAIRGAEAGAVLSFPLTFPADYHGAEVAGKTAQFEVTLHAVEEREMPELDGKFAESVGIADGSVDSLKSEVLINVEREVTARLRVRNRDNVMDALLAAVTFPVPRALVEAEQQNLHQMASAEISARGGTQFPDVSVFAVTADRRVRLSLILGEIVRRQQLTARPEQVRAAVESVARGYENPAEVVKWYMSDRQRLAEVEAAVLEDNVVDWAMAGAQVSERPLVFDELMDAARV